MRLSSATIVFVALLTQSMVVPAAEPTADPSKSGLTNPFFALCISTDGPKYRTPVEQAKVLSDLGYAGNCHLWCDRLPEALAAVDGVDLKLFQVYVRVSIDPAKPKYDPRLKEVIRLLEGRDTILGLLVTGGPPSSTASDPRAVEIIREIAEMAAASRIKLALYPHAGDWLERVEDGVRVAEKVDRPNVGVTFNLCHWLKVDDEKNLAAVLKRAMPHLFVVTVNGADSNAKGAGWDRLLQRLDRGTFDNRRLLETLARLGYTGPIGLQCYGITGDVRENLSASMDAWRKISAGITPPTAKAPRKLLNPFFAFDNGTGRGRVPPKQQAKMLSELGYAGIGYTGAAGIPPMLAALEKHKLEMFSIYVGAKLGLDGPSYDPDLKTGIEALKGRPTMIWLTITGQGPDSEQQAVQVVREIATLARAADLRVALYPHTGFYVARTEDAIRVAEKVNRTNVGVSLNLCHWLKLDHEKNAESLIRAAMPHLFLVSINGADRGDTRRMGWDRLIQTLDRGSFDVDRFLGLLERAGYTGPVGLQCYAVKGDIRENLERSMTAWRGFRSRAAAEQPE